MSDVAILPAHQIYPERTASIAQEANNWNVTVTAAVTNASTNTFEATLLTWFTGAEGDAHLRPLQDISTTPLTPGPAGTYSGTVFVPVASQAKAIRITEWETVHGDAVNRREVYFDTFFIPNSD